MDLETENRITSILLKEAAELRRQADRQGVYVYLQQPKVRGRPNSRFLTATVLGVQQANRAVEVNEMWRVRQKELELDDRLEGRSKNDGRHSDFSASCTSIKRMAETSYSMEDGGLRDEEIEQFLQSRVKRGRGSIGSRMDETGPYLPTNSDSPEMVSTNAGESSSDEELREHRWKKEKAHSKSSDKKHRQKHKTKENPTDKRKKREKKSRHGK